MASMCEQTFSLSITWYEEEKLYNKVWLLLNIIGCSMMIRPVVISLSTLLWMLWLIVGIKQLVWESDIVCINLVRVLAYVSKKLFSLRLFLFPFHYVIVWLLLLKTPEDGLILHGYLEKLSLACIPIKRPLRCSDRIQSRQMKASSSNSTEQGVVAEHLRLLLRWSLLLVLKRISRGKNGARGVQVSPCVS